MPDFLCLLHPKSVEGLLATMLLHGLGLVLLVALAQLALCAEDFYKVGDARCHIATCHADRDRSWESKRMRQNDN